VTNGTASEHYTYDGIGRNSQTVTKNGNATVLTESYTFTVPSGEGVQATTSMQVATNRLQAAGYDVTYTYTYDDNGNILSISDGTRTRTYEYDSANQLIRENLDDCGYTLTWQYDNAGNIVCRNLYPYMTGSLEDYMPAYETFYSYDEYTWGDLLTSYDGKAFSYDAIGNLTYDGTWTYTWEHGRELTAMSSGETWAEHNAEVDEMLELETVDITEDVFESQMKATSSAFAVDMLVLKFIQGMPVVGFLGGAANPVYYQKILRYVQLKYKKRYLMKQI